MIGNKNLLDPIVSGTQPSPESIALLFSQLSPFVITTIYMKGGGDTRVSAVRRPNGSLIIKAGTDRSGVSEFWCSTNRFRGHIL